MPAAPFSALCTKQPRRVGLLRVSDFSFSVAARFLGRSIHTLFTVPLMNNRDSWQSQEIRDTEKVLLKREDLATPPASAQRILALSLSSRWTRAVAPWASYSFLLCAKKVAFCLEISPASSTSSHLQDAPQNIHFFLASDSHLSPCRLPKTLLPSVWLPGRGP